MAGLVELLGPGRCAGCGAIGAVLCGSCVRSLRRPEGLLRPAWVRRLIAAWTYEGAARSLVLALKLSADRDAAVPLVDGMVAAARAAGVPVGVVTWVPARDGDARRRGFDHARILAEAFALRVGLPVEPLLRRRRATLDQAGLSAEQRRANLRGAFAALAGPQVVILVDDLVTTGATSSSCARVLRAKGAKRVEVVVPCAAERSDPAITR